MIIMPMALIVSTTMSLAADPPQRPGSISPPECPEHEHLCVQAKGPGVINLNTGSLHFSGTVTGSLVSPQLIFQGDTLSATRNAAGEWNLLMLEGNALLEQGIMHMQSDKVRADIALKHLEMEGTPTEPVLILVEQEIIPQTKSNRAIIGRPESEAHTARSESEAGAATEDSPPPPTESRILANRVVLDDTERLVQLSGGVRIEQLDGTFLMVCNEGTFNLGPDNRLEGFRAQGNVQITQPGRVLSSDLAFSRDDLQTIVLVGNARVQQPGAFDLTGERLEVRGEPGVKASVRSETPDRPVSLSLKLGEEKRSYELKSESLQQLRSQGMPPYLTARLTPLLGHRFASREEFSIRIRALLSPDEANRHLEAILNASR